MFYLTAHAAPPTIETEAGGAYVSCWVKAADAETAELVARRGIKDHGWTPLEVSDQRQVTRSDYSFNSASLSSYDSAAEDGACFTFHIYPRESTPPHT